MSAGEIQTVLRRYQARLAVILSPDELALYERYQRRVQAAIARGESAPVEMSAAEQAVVDQIEADTEARALNKQLFALLRIEHLPQ